MGWPPSTGSGRLPQPPCRSPALPINLEAEPRRTTCFLFLHHCWAAQTTFCAQPGDQNAPKRGFLAQRSPSALHGDPYLDNNNPIVPQAFPGSSHKSSWQERDTFLVPRALLWPWAGGQLCFPGRPQRHGTAPPAPAQPGKDMQPTYGCWEVGSTVPAGVPLGLLPPKPLTLLLCPTNM